MKVLQLGVAVLLFLSILVSTVSSLRFNNLADNSRRDWRKKLYSFMSDTDWKRLVENPIGSGRAVYWVSWSFCLVLYLVMIRYFLSLAVPDFILIYVDAPLNHLLDCLCAVLSIRC